MMFYMSVPPPFCFCSPKGTIMKLRSIPTCIMLSLPQYLIVKLLDAYIVFCKVVFYTHLLYLFLLWQINTYLLTYLQHHETLEYCYLYASNNEQLLKSPHLILNQLDLQSNLNHLAVKDVPISLETFIL